MPELPEVETVMRGLAPVMEGQRFAHVAVNRLDLRWPFPPNMAERLTGARVLGLRRRSKYILADLSTDESLLIHLGMSGRMLISGDPLGQFQHAHPQREKHDHVVFDMENGARVTFNDPRRFGAMDLIGQAEQDKHRLLVAIGPEPLGNQFHAQYLAEKLLARKAPIKTLLLDQRIVAGLGNIYVCEALFRSGIHPSRPGGQLTLAELEILEKAIREVLIAAIESGGSSLRDFRQADGELGYFQHSFAVYGREAKPCHAPGCTGCIARITQSGRSSFFCPECQSELHDKP